MKKFAIITGASNGIGKSFTETFAQDGINLVLVARSLDKLQSIKKDLEKKYGIEVVVIEKDLSQPTAAQEVYAFTQAKKIKIEYLVNNAWFGDYGAFADSDNEKNIQMLQLNIITLTSLTRYYLEDMKKHNVGKILNVGSTAGFQPGPYMAIYFASKAYVQNFSLALANELENTKITVTTLCPWPTQSNFEKHAKAEGSLLFAGKLPSSDSVARLGYQNMMNGKKLVVHGRMNALKAYSIRLLPMYIVLKMMNFIMKK